MAADQRLTADQAAFLAASRRIADYNALVAPAPPKAPRIPPACPSEGRYRKHLKAMEDCPTCRAFMTAKRRKRNTQHPEWQARRRAERAAAAKAKAQLRALVTAGRKANLEVARAERGVEIAEELRALWAVRRDAAEVVLAQKRDQAQACDTALTAYLGQVSA